MLLLTLSASNRRLACASKGRETRHVMVLVLICNVKLTTAWTSHSITRMRGFTVRNKWLLQFMANDGSRYMIKDGLIRVEKEHIITY